MKNSIAETLGKLAYLSDSLNKASDSLSEQILEVESALQRYRLGVEAWVTSPLFSQDVYVSGPLVSPMSRSQHLGYGKNKGKWGLLVMDSLDGEPEDVRFLREESREVKLAAVNKLPELLKKLLEESTKLSKDTDAKTNMAAEIAAAIRQWTLHDAAPPLYKDSWTQTVNQRTFVYTTEQREDGGYYHRVKHGGAHADGQSTAKLTRQQVEALPALRSFVSIYFKGFTTS